MPLQNLEHAKTTMKWLYLVSGMTKWGKWLDTTSPIHVAYSVVGPGTMDLVYQVTFTGYVVLHIVMVIIAILKKRR